VRDPKGLFDTVNSWFGYAAEGASYGAFTGPQSKRALSFVPLG